MNLKRAFEKLTRIESVVRKRKISEGEGLYKMYCDIQKCYGDGESLPYQLWREQGGLEDMKTQLKELGI